MKRQGAMVLGVVGVGFLGVTAATLELTASPPAATASAYTPRAGATTSAWCQPIKVFYPPANFNPLRATNAQLEEDGLPARPPRSSRAAYAAWTKIVSHAIHFTTPEPTCGTTRH